MTDITSYRGARQARHAGRRTPLLLGFVVFGLLWILLIPIRETYVPSEEDLPALASSSLLGPNARWQDWFTQGYLRFWDLYPDKPARGLEATAQGFTRPAFQFVIYLAHFVLGRDWAWYQLINCFAVAGMAAVAFQIAQAVLGLRTGSSLVATLLVVLSPPVLENWLSGLAYASEPLATVLVAGAFLAVSARRDFLCFVLLLLGLLTKETTVWAPLAAAITIMVRPGPNDSPRGRVFTAAAMFLPVAMWLVLRFAFFGGLGGTYITAYVSPRHFLKLIFLKLTHVHYLFITHMTGESPSQETANLILNWGTALLIYALLALWALRILPQAVNHLRYAVHETRWPTVDAIFLVALWAGIALVFNFAIPLFVDRYATSVVVFAWPALVAEVERRGKATVWLALAVCCAMSLTRSSYYFVESIADPVQNFWRNKISSMNAELRQVPTNIRQIYVLSAEGLESANPEYVRLALGVPAEIVRVIEIEWHCHEARDSIAFDHNTSDGVVSMTVTLPTCANFQFYTDRFNNDFANGHLYRNETMSYDFSDAYLTGHTTPWRPNFYLGQRMTVDIRPNGPARFIIGQPNGVAWFDAP